MKTPTETPSPGSPVLRNPTLKEAVAALPLSSSGPMSRERMQGVAEQGDAKTALWRCIDELTSIRGLVEVLRVAATEAQAPMRDTRLGIDALAETLRDQIRRLQDVLEGALRAVPDTRQPEAARQQGTGSSLSITGDGALICHRPQNDAAPAATPSPAGAPDAFTRCYRYAYQALTDPEETARLIDDPVLSGYLTGEGLRQKGELYDAVAALLRLLDGRAVDSAAVRSALSRGFRKRGWPWPKTFGALRRHILTHTPESR